MDVCARDVLNEGLSERGSEGRGGERVSVLCGRGRGRREEVSGPPPDAIVINSSGH